MFFYASPSGWADLHLTAQYSKNLFGKPRKGYGLGYESGQITQTLRPRMRIHRLISLLKNPNL